MVTVVSLLSLLGVVIVPCIRSERGHRYILVLLISMGVSALMCDAMFELLPTVITYVYLNIVTVITYVYLNIVMVITYVCLNIVPTKIYIFCPNL